METASDIAFIPLSGDLDVSSAPDVRASIDALADAGCRRIVLGMGQVGYADSAGMSMLIAELRRMRGLGGLISLVDVSPGLYRILRTLRLVDLMPVRLATERSSVPELDPGVQPLRRTTLAVDASRLTDARHQIATILHGLPLTEDEVFDLELACGEALGNAVDHACPDGILATVSAYADRVIVEVEDCGRGFSIGDDEHIEVDASSERGRGIELMRLLMDSVTIGLRPQGAGTCVRLAKLTRAGARQ